MVAFYSGIFSPLSQNLQKGFFIMHGWWQSSNTILTMGNIWRLTLSYKQLINNLIICNKELNILVSQCHSSVSESVIHDRVPMNNYRFISHVDGIAFIGLS
jgi:hypothetical protein